MNFKMIYSFSVERKKFLVIFIRGMIKCPRKGLKCKIKKSYSFLSSRGIVFDILNEKEYYINHITRIYAEKIY